MSVISNIQKLGLRKSADIFINYRIDLVIRKMMKLMTHRLPLKNIIIIESHNDFDCNGGAFYKYLLDHDYNKKYMIIWLLKNPRGKEPLPSNVKTFPLRKLSVIRDYYICRARYFTSDNEITDKVRPDQVSIYFDHGPFGLKNVKPFFNLSDSVDYFLSSSENYDPIYCNQMSKPYPNPKLIHLGYPMHDVFYRETENEVKKVCKKDFSHVVLWMPTFRQGGGNLRNDSRAEYPMEIPLIENVDQLREIADLLRKLDTLLIIKLHPMQRFDPDNALFSFKDDNVLILTAQDMKDYELDNYRLLKNVDALISDYSSIAYSFILLDRPIAFVLSDVKELKYGFSVANPDFFLAGNHIYTLKDFEEFLEEIGRGEDRFKQKREDLCAWLHKYNDGNSSERIAKFLKL